MRERKLYDVEGAEEVGGKLVTEVVVVLILTCSDNACACMSMRGGTGIEKGVP